MRGRGGRPATACACGMVYPDKRKRSEAERARELE